MVYFIWVYSCFEFVTDAIYAIGSMCSKLSYWNYLSSFWDDIKSFVGNVFGRHFIGKRTSRYSTIIVCCWLFFFMVLFVLFLIFALIGYDFQHNNWILTICIPSPTAWPFSEFMARAESKLLLGSIVFLQKRPHVGCCSLLYFDVVPYWTVGSYIWFVIQRKASVIFLWKKDCFF